MELDKRVGEYAAAIARDADLLLEDAANLNQERQSAIDQIKNSITYFISLCDEYHSILSTSCESRNLSFEFRTPLTSIAGFCDLLTLEAFGTLNELQRQQIQQIKAAQEFILSAFNAWMNQ